MNDVYYYSLVASGDTTLLVQINLEREASHAVFACLWYTANPEAVLVVSSHLIGSFETNTLGNYWVVKMNILEY